MGALALCAARSAPAQAFDVRRLTNDGRMGREPSIGESGLVAWVSYGTNEDLQGVADLVVYDGTTNRMIAESSEQYFGTTKPLVQSNTVVWIGYFGDMSGERTWTLREVPNRDEGAEEIPAMFVTEMRDGEPILVGVTNLSEGVTNVAEQVRRHPSGLSEVVRWDKDGGPFKRITVNQRHDFSVSSWGNLMAWQVAKGFPFGWEIMAWDNGAFIQLTTNYYYDMAPKVQGRQVAWYGWDGHDFEIFLYDRDKDVTTQITSNQYDDVSPNLWGGQVVWEGYPAAESDIFLWRNGETKKLSDNIEDDFAPRIWNGQVVWQGFDGDDFEIYFYDGSNPAALPFKLTNNRFDDTNPEIGERFITWMGYTDNWDAEIYALDKSAGTKGGSEIQITDNDEDDRDPRTAGSRIVWQGERDGNVGIFLAEPK